MSISSESQILQTCENLCKIEATPEDHDAFVKSFHKVFEIIETVKNADIPESLTPLYNPLEVDAWIREDEVSGVIEQSQALENAPDADQGYFKINKVIE